MPTKFSRYLARGIAVVLSLTSTVTASPLQLDYVPIIYFQFTGVNMAWRQGGELDALTGLRLEHGETVPTTPAFPDPAFDKPLIAIEEWNAFARLSPVALANFELIAAGDPWVIDGRAYREVRINPEANVTTGPLLNVSTRAWVSNGETAAIAGFVIADRPRAVLIRGVGPTLDGLGVANHVADPFVTLFESSMPFYESTDWGQWDKAAKIAAAVAVGAFPLVDNSKDAALVVDLAPGSYTVHMGVESGAPGIGLIEVYILPDNSLVP